MAHALADPWTQGFVQRAFLELALLGIVGSALGFWVLFYELSYGAESLAHALFPGLVLAALAGVPLVLGAAGGVLMAAAAIAIFGRTPEIGRDTAIAVVITTLFGLGVLLALAPASPPGLNELLFGDLLGVSGTDLAIAASLSLVVLTSLAVLHRQLLAVGFDRVNAVAFGARPVLVDLALLGLLAAAIVIGVQGLGNLLVLAVLVGPAATARVVTRRLLPMMFLAAVIAIGSGAAGLYLSYYAETAGGASVAGITLAVYLGVRLGATVQASVARRFFANSRKRARSESSGPSGVSSA
jgi:ABC-type Mn2+/Zn2+ transport system permease subunit